MKEVVDDLKTLADDVERLAKAETDDKGMQRALLSIVSRIRHAAKILRVHGQPTP